MKKFYSNWLTKLYNSIIWNLMHGNNSDHRQTDWQTIIHNYVGLLSPPAGGYARMQLKMLASIMNCHPYCVIVYYCPENGSVNSSLFFQGSSKASLSFWIGWRIDLSILFRFYHELQIFIVYRSFDEVHNKVTLIYFTRVTEVKLFNIYIILSTSIYMCN